MALKSIKTSYNAGELSQYMDGREDINKYHNGCSKLINALVLPHGGFTKRPGTEYIATAANRANLIPFEFSVDDTLVLEFSNLLLRFYKDQAQVSFKVGTEDISSLDNIVAHWLLNENTGTTVLDDDGATHNGTATVDANILAADGMVNGCFDLDGQYAVTMTDHNDFSFDDSGTNPFSLVCWAYVTQKGGLQVLLSKWKEATAREWRFSLTNDRKLQLHLSDDSIEIADVVSHYKLNDNAASTAVDDDIELQDGVATSNTNTLTATGKVDKCFDFAGADAVEINDNVAYSFGDGSDDSPFSIAAWIYATTHTDVQTIISKLDFTSGSELREWNLDLLISGKPILWLWDESANAYVWEKANDALSVGWHFVVVTYDGRGGATAQNGITFYIDGSSVDSGGGSIGAYDSMENTATKVVIGAYYGTDGNLDDYFQDKIDNIAIFSAELTQANVTNLWNSGDGTETFAATFPSAVSDDALTTGWHFLCATYDSTGGATAANGIILYVDGVAVDSTKTNEASYVAMENTGTTPKIGCQESAAAANEKFWEDKIDEVSVFKDVLTPTEVASLYSTTPYSIVSPYTSAESFEIHVTQSADVMYIAHEDHHPKKLSRFGDLNWTIVDVPFTGGPFLDENVTAASLVGFARLGGTARSEYYFPAGATGTLTASGTGNQPFNSNMVGALWLVKHTRDNDNDTDTFAKDTNVVPTLTTYASGAIFIKGDATATFEPIATGKMAQLWRKEGNGNWQTFRSFRGAVAFSWTEDEDDVLYAMTRSDNSINGTLTAKNQINRGIVKITAFTSATVVEVEVIDKVLSNNSDDTAVTTPLWAEGAWSDYRGYPRTVIFFEDRLWWASSTNNPDTLWSSQSGNTGGYENMEYSELGLDTDAITAPINDNEVSQIQWMQARQVMAVGAANKEYRFGAANADDPVTPSDRKATPQTGFSSGDIQPVVLNDTIFFFQRNGKKLGAMKFDAITENFDVDDATLLAYKLFDSAPTNMAVQRVPDSIIWTIRTDGIMPTFTYEPKEEVAGWSRQIFGNSSDVDTATGYVESTAVIHGSSEDEVWVCVRRVINTATVYYIEKFKPRDWGSDIEDACYVDSAVTSDTGSAVSTVTAAHLKGETVSVFADGVVFDDAVANASTGVVTLKLATVATDADVVQCGLPYTMKARTMRLSVPQEGNTIQTRIKRVHSVVSRYIRSLLGSAGVEYGGTEYLTDIEATYSTASADTDEQKRLTQGGFNEESYITILSDDPVPFTGLSTVISFEVEERR